MQLELEPAPRRTRIELVEARIRDIHPELRGSNYSLTSHLRDQLRSLQAQWRRLHKSEEASSC